MQRITLFFIAFFSMNLLFSQTTWDGAAWDAGEPNANTNAIIAGPLLMSEITILNPGDPHELYCKGLTIEAGGSITYDVNDSKIAKLLLLGAGKIYEKST